MASQECKLADLTLVSTQNEPGCGWQSDSSLAQCTSYLFEHKVAADVTFQVSYQQTENRLVRAHKTLLLARSPVFFSMFCGQMREAGDVIVITDIHPDAFSETLRFIYTDEANITADNVVFVMYAAKKYLINNLVLKSTAFLEEQVAPSNVASVWEHSMFFELEDLTKKSLVLIKKKTKEVLQSEAFLSLSSESLGKILDLDLLNAEEIDVFNACLAWAKAECERQDILEDASNLRSILSPHIVKIRFPTMSLEQFSDIVMDTDILTHKEGNAIFRYLTASKKPDNADPFSLVKRKHPFRQEKVFMPGPFQNVAIYGPHQVDMECTISKAVDLCSLYILACNYNMKCIITITNNDCQVYSGTYYSYQQPNLEVVTENGNACYRLDITANNIRLQPGKTTLTIVSSAQTVIKPTNLTSNAGKVQLKSESVTVDVVSQKPHSLYGLAVKLVELE